MTARGAGVALAAPAKVNLFLHVHGRRADGFHELDTLFQAVALHDDLEIEVAGEGVRLVVEGADLGPPEQNLVYRAAASFLDESGVFSGVRIRLRKRIPAGGGLGGGSSDAAATLRALNGLAGEPLSPARLLDMGAALGSDVPFFLGSSPLARGAGRGERLRPLTPLPVAHLVVVLPPVHVATGGAFAALASSREGGTSEAPGPLAAVGDPSDWPAVFASAHNDFESVVPKGFPEVATTLAALRQRGGEGVQLSGSGAACFAIFTDAAACEGAAKALGLDLGWPAVATRTLTRWPRPSPLSGGG